MTKIQLPALHGVQHLPDGSDPIPGLFLGGPGSFTDWVLTLPGVWGYWPLQEASGNAIDQGPTAADMQPVGTPAYHATGPNTDDLPYAVRLTGSPQNTISDDSFYNTANQLNMDSRTELTAMAWIKPDSGAGSSWRLPILGTWDVFRTGWVLYMQDTTRQLVFSSGNGSSTTNLVGPAITMDAWTLVAATRDASSAIRLYVNGSQVATTGSSVLAGSGHGIRLGAADFQTTDPDSYHFYGNIAGALFVDHALTGAEILDGYNAATGGSGVIAGSYGDATHVGQFTVDSTGRLTAASNVTIAGTGGGSPTDTQAWLPLTTTAPVASPGLTVQTPSGTIDGSNAIFMLAQVPSPAANLLLFKNGLAMTQPGDYTISGTTITFVTAPTTGSVLLAAIPSTSSDDVLVFDDDHSLIPTLVPF